MIDWSVTSELLNDIGAEDFAEVVEIFLADADRMVEGLRHGDTLEAQLHELKGAALAIGLRALAMLCQRSEDMAAAGLGHMVDLTHVSQCYRLSRDAFLDRLPDRLGLSVRSGIRQG